MMGRDAPGQAGLATRSPGALTRGAANICWLRPKRPGGRVRSLINQSTDRLSFETRPIAASAGMLIVVIATLAAPPDAPLSSWQPIVAAALFFGAQSAHPRLRFASPIVSPRNCALGLAFLQLVVFPTLINFSDPLYRGTLPFLPSDGLIVQALVLQMFAFCGLCAGLLLTGWRSSTVRHGLVEMRHLSLILVLGVAGLVLRFQDPARFITYLRGAGAQNQLDNLGSVISAFLLPCLSFGLFMLALRQAEKSKHALNLRVVILLLMAVMAGALFSYNRAAAMVPLICWLGVYAQRVRRVRLLGGVLLLVFLFSSVVLLTQLRTVSHRDEMNSLGYRTEASNWSGYTLGVNELQLYGAAPQFLAYGLGITPPVKYGQVTLNAALSPVPILGKWSRETDGTRIFNAGVYGVNSATVDQTLPTALEFYWDFGPAGVLVGFILVGALVGFCQRRFESAISSRHAFVWAFIGLWSSAMLILQIETYVQIMIGWSVPMFLLFHGSKVSSTTNEGFAKPELVHVDGATAPLREFRGILGGGDGRSPSTDWDKLMRVVAKVIPIGKG
jgi:hypothetical protein